MRQLVRLNTPNRQGVSLRQTLELGRKLDRKAGKPEDYIAKRYAALDPIPLETGTEYLLQVFDSLSSTRQFGPAGPFGISHIEIKAYSELMREPLEPWEVAAIRGMDSAYLDEAYKLQKPAEA